MHIVQVICTVNELGRVMLFHVPKNYADYLRFFGKYKTGRGGLHVLRDSSIKTPQDLIKHDPYFAQFKPIIIK